uniref:Uncharacterized protein n=1 Tax=Oryza meridionalis TaxID=40149 RepID=A0A0E0C8A5_9ORYZ
MEDSVVGDGMDSQFPVPTGHNSSYRKRSSMRNIDLDFFVLTGGKCGCENNRIVLRCGVCTRFSCSSVQSLNVQNWVSWHHLHCFLGQLNATKLQGLTFIFICAMSQSNKGINFLFIVVQFWFCLIIWEKERGALSNVPQVALRFERATKTFKDRKVAVQGKKALIKWLPGVSSIALLISESFHTGVSNIALLIAEPFFTDLDHEAAAAAAPYHALKGDLREHDEASGRRCSQACLLWTLGLLGLTIFLSTFAFFSTTTRPAATPTLGGSYHDHDAFSVSIAGYEGIDPGSAGAAVSRAFRVTLGTANGACVDRAAMTVLYSGVALGWAHAEPRDCAAGRRERDVEVVARGQGVGLSDRLRGRMALEWRSSGALVLDIDVKVFDEVTSPAYAARHVPNRLILCKVTLDEQGSDSSACPWFELL